MTSNFQCPHCNKDFKVGGEKPLTLKDSAGRTTTCLLCNATVDVHDCGLTGHESFAMVPGARPAVGVLSDRELLEEVVISQRMTRDLVEKFVNDMAKNPMLGMFGKMLGGKK